MMKDPSKKNPTFAFAKHILRSTKIAGANR